MSYTIKKLASISGITTRTLRFYDEIELLKPAYNGANGYRYYEEEQLLLLQQILFFRELGFKLSNIQEMLTNSDFDKIKALQMHKAVLEHDLSHKAKLIETIDKTILHLQEGKSITDKELYYGFDSLRQKEHDCEHFNKLKIYPR